MRFTWAYALSIILVVLIVTVAVASSFTSPVEKLLKDFLIWVDRDLGPWGPLVLVAAYVPLTILSVPPSVLTVGGGYLFGFTIGFLADSIGATIGAAVAFLLGRTVGNSLVVSRLNDYPKFRDVAIAIQRSGFKIVLLLRLVPWLPFGMLNYLLSVTPVSLGEYTLASWLGMMPLTLALVYVGTTLKDISDVTHGWGALSKTHWALIILSLVISVILMICVTRVAKSALDKALAECECEDNQDIDIEGTGTLQRLAADSSADLNQPLIISDQANGNQQK